ncbi:hypothetical protein BDB00DRAFT_789915 [Zychaea mexicana]|uniref:uncharacterized protein n=1 Tax=Zychaea mexicana TaxID=64656 RepID=UPI0022FE81B9|nr:uncharacterized protein BDB00DRAFT_789915 [Zychaea mexicana]KAI9490976.1 hypothetical protein BDB00DRAFT_789915 [Zychaea mexicana]
MALEYLSSDIVFPSDSTEPKLATTTVSKLPGPVDWAFHDYYSTACEKASLPVHSITDYAQWTKHHDDDEVDNDAGDSILKKSSTHRTKQDEQLLYLFGKRSATAAAPGATTTTSSPPPVPQSPSETTASNLRAALCGALEHVDNAMQDNHLTRLDKYTPTSYQSNKEYRWEDEVLYGSLSFAPEAASGGVGGVGATGADLFLPTSTTPIGASEAAHHRFHDDHGDFLYERRSLSDDDDDDLVLGSPNSSSHGGPVLLNSSGITSYITSSIHPRHEQPPSEPAYYPPLAAAAPSPAALSPSSTAARVEIPPPPPAVEGKPTIAKSKVWQGLVGRLKKNLAKPFRPQSSLSSASEALSAATTTTTTSAGTAHFSSSSRSPPSAQPHGRLKRLLFKPRQN